MRCDATGDHLQLLVLRAMHMEVLQQVHDFYLVDTWARKRRGKRHYRSFTGVRYGKIVIIRLSSEMNVLR